MKYFTQPLSVEEKVLLYRKKPSQLLFEDIFRECHSLLLKFLMSKRLSFDDAEDLIQEYFIQSFDYALENFNPEYKRSFINYIKTMIIKKRYSFESKQQRFHILTHSRDSYYNTEDDTIHELKPIHQESSRIHRLLKDEIKAFLREHIFAIENENHRSAVILRLCIPLSPNLSFSDISNMLGCHTSTLSTWLHRGIYALQENIEKDKELMPCSLEDILMLFHDGEFCIDEDIVNTIDDERIRGILTLYLFKKKDYQYIQHQYSLESTTIKHFLVKGIFLILKAINQNKSLLLRV